MDKKTNKSAKGSFGKRLREDIKNYDRHNAEERPVLDAHFFSRYKGTIVLKLPKSRSAASFGVIFMGRDIRDTRMPRHEYGHRIQLKNMGLARYTRKIAVPSLTANILDRLGKLPYDYYGSPWEAEADELGGVIRRADNTPWPEEAYSSYSDLLKLFLKKI